MSRPIIEDDLIRIMQHNEDRLNRLEVDQSFPVGLITLSSIPSPHDGFLICDGTSVLRVQYPELWSFIGVRHGTPLDAETFVLPNIAPLGVSYFQIAHGFKAF